MPIAPSAGYSQSAPLRPHDSVNDGSLPVVIHAAMRQDIELSPPGTARNQHRESCDHQDALRRGDLPGQRDGQAKRSSGSCCE